MPDAPLDFTSGQLGDLDEVAGHQPVALNVALDADGKTARVRPGIRVPDETIIPTTSPSTSPIIGWAQMGTNWLVAVREDRSVWALSLETVSWTALSSDSVPDSLLDGLARPTFVVGRERIVIAGGGRLLTWTGTGMCAPLNAGEPANIVGICTNQQSVVALVDTGVMYLSSPGESEWTTAWDSLDSQTADAKPDGGVSIMDLNNRVFAFGTTTVQAFAPDDNVILTPTATVDSGLAAPMARVARRSTLYWLSHDRRIVSWNGYEAEEKDISSPYIAHTLSTLDTISDCWAFWDTTAGHDSIVFVFPTEKRTFVFDTQTERWHERASTSSGERVAYAPVSWFHDTMRDVRLVGLDDGSVGEVHLNALSDIGEPIDWILRTGFLDRGSSKSKQTEMLQLTMRRGEAASSDEAVLVRYRDGLGGWRGPLTVTMGTEGDYTVTKRIRPVGRPYVRRQWELSGSARSRTVVAAAVETFSELGD